MQAHELGCCDSRPRRHGWAAGGVLFTALALLMPKCPLCAAVWLGALGLSGLATWFDPRLLWLAAALAVAAAGASMVHRFASRKRQS